MCALLLGLRADSTTTEAVLAHSDGRTFGQVTIPNGEARSSKELLERAFQEASIDYPGLIPPLVAVVALPGLHTVGLRRAAGETVSSVLPSGSHIALCDELEPLLAGGLSGHPGHVLSVGQQAAVGTVSRDGVFSRTEEPEEMMGQEGSGLWIGTRTLQLAARLLEGRLPDTPRLVGALTRHFDQSSLQDVWDSVMAEAPDAGAITALASRTISLAEFPDPEPACRALVVRAARRLSELVLRATEDNDGLSLGITHGVCAKGALLDEVLRQTPNHDWHPAHLGPLDGCLHMARVYSAQGLKEDDGSVVDVGQTLWSLLRDRHSDLVAFVDGPGREN